MLPVRFDRRAIEEFEEAAQWYESRETGLVVLAIAHGHRKPGYWRERAPEK